jgi:hypothetical protein
MPLSPLGGIRVPEVASGGEQSTQWWADFRARYAAVWARAAHPPSQ